MTAKQKRALACLLTAPTVQAAAMEAKISYPTLRRWLSNDTEFRKEYSSALQELVESAATQARQGMSEAVAVLREVMADTEAAPNARVAAARTVIDGGARLIEMQSYETRIAELERVLLEEEER